MQPHKRLSPSEQVIFNALGKSDRTIEELIDVLYSGVRDGGPEGARSVVRAHICNIRGKIPGSIANRTVYTLE